MTPTSRVPRSFRMKTGPVLLALGWVALTACQTTRPDRIIQYQNAVEGIQTSTDALLSIDHAWTRADFVARFSGSSEAKFSSLVIQVQEDGSMKVEANPLYLQIRQTRISLDELNQAFLDYLDLLVKLSAPDLIKAAEFDQMAADLNKRVSSALKAASQGGAAETAGLLSSTAAKAWHAYLENHRRSALRQALEANQETVGSYAERCAQLVHTAGANLLMMYTSQTDLLKPDWDTNTDPKNRVKLTEKLLSLNDEFMDLQQVLKELQLAYQNLPKAHNALSATLSGSRPPADGLLPLIKNGRRLNRLNADLAKAGAKAKKAD